MVFVLSSLSLPVLLITAVLLESGGVEVLDVEEDEGFLAIGGSGERDDVGDVLLFPFSVLKETVLCVRDGTNGAGDTDGGTL